MRRPTRRRRVVTALAAAPLLLGLAACGGGVTETPTGDGASPTDVPAGEFTPATSGDLRLYTWSDYFPQDLAQQFISETGINLTVDYYDSNETLQAKLIATDGTGYDVVVPSDYMVQILVADGMLRQFDATSLPNGKNIKPEFLDSYFDPGRKYSTPYLYGTTSFMYDGASIPEDQWPESWADYFNPPAAAGKIGVFNDQVEVINNALRVTGGEFCTEDPTELQAVSDLLEAFKPHVGTINSDAIIDRLSASEQKMAMIWNGAGHRVKQKKPDAVYVYPPEGITLWQDNFTIPKGAENIDQALTFLNWMMDPKNMAEAANFQGYNSGIVGVDELLSPEMKADPAVVIPSDYTLAAPVPPCTNEQLNNYSKIWEKFKS